MNKIVLFFGVAFFVFLGMQDTYAQFWKRKKEIQKNEIDTPKKRKKNRTTYKTEAKVKTKRNREFMSKKSKNLEYRVNVSRKSNEVAAVVDEKQTLRSRTTKPLRKLKKSKNKSEKMAVSAGSVTVRPLGSYNRSATDESVTQKVKKKSLRSQKKSRKRQEERLADSDGPISIRRERYRKEPGTVYREDKKGGSKYKSRSEEGSFTMKGISPDKKKKIIAGKSRRASNFRGDVAMARPGKTLHPSSNYLNGKKQKSIEDKEKLRKKELKKSRGRNSGQPLVVTRKKKKPKYDSRESEIWNE